NSGNVVKWQVSTSSTFASSITDINVTTTNMNYTLNSTGNYYFRAAVQNNGCGSASYTPIYKVTVVSGTAPVGGVLTSTEHCGGSSNSGTLTLSGYTGTISMWQYSTDGGIIWNNVTNTSSTLNYSGVGANRIYRVKLTNGTCGTAYSDYGTVTVFGTTVTRWDGGVSTQWQTASNWCGGIADLGIDVVINTSAPNDLMLDQTRVIGNLDFNGTNRIINIGNYDLTAASIEDAHSASFIRTPGIGKLKMSIANGETKLFPVGNSAYNPVSITNNSGSADYMTVRVIDEVYNNGLTGYTSTLPRVKRTWDIHKQNANGGSGLTFVFNWNTSESYMLTNPTLYHYENAVWNKQTGTTTYSSNSLTYAGYTGTFSPFAIGSGLTPLPVKLVSFDAIKQAASKTVLVSWETSEEIDNSSFEVQRSLDGINWVTIGVVESAGNSHSINAYSFVDKNPSDVNYYRLKQVDMSGESNYSNIRKVDFAQADGDVVRIYPNPSKGSVNIAVAEDATYSVMDINGQVISEGEVNGEVKLNDLPTGLYMVKVQVGDAVHAFKLLIQ
ncbi:MAG: T9SS type A sorting domain-containing protein, partial [Bacteroidia bacterium]|nr:T9SS type A sorting domain-containing protein [Bacteroidia bacterium]